MKKKHLIPDQKTWPKTLSAKAEEVWDSALRAQSTKDAPEFDVADEIATDLDALECISRAGYQGSAGISYLKKMAMNRDASWAAWYKSNSLGLDYRIERSSALLEEAIAQGKFPSGKEFREKRFSVAVKEWNLLP